MCALRIDPPFQVLTGIMGEDPDIFRAKDAPGVDPVDRRVL